MAPPTLTLFNTLKMMIFRRLMMNKTKQHYEYLKEVHSQLCDEMRSLQEDYHYLLKEVHLLHDFLHGKHLEDEYIYFVKNAYETHDEELPFCKR